MPWIERTARNADGLRLTYYLLGEATRPPLVLLPGITMPALGMEFVARALVNWFQILVPDLRGRGRSDRAPAGRHRLQDYAGDLRTVLRHQGIVEEQCVVLGHSLGARIGAYAANTGTNLRGLILVDPPMSRPGRAYPTTWESFEEQLALDPSGGAESLSEIERLFPSWPQSARLLRLRLLTTCDPVAVHETWQGFAQDDFRVLWSGLEVPALLIAGGHSPVVLKADIAELRSLRPDLPVVSIDDAGHMVPWDDLPGLVTTVRAWLSELPARRAR